MSKKTKIIIGTFIGIVALFYWLVHLTEGKYYKHYSPYGEYSMYASEYKYYKYLKLNFPASRSGDAPGRVYLFDEINQEVISSCHIGMISNIGDVEWFDTFISDKGAHTYLKLPKPLLISKIPNDYEQITEIIGNLNPENGLADEKVIVYNTKDTTDFGKVREVQILKTIDGKWTLWKKSRNAILASKGKHDGVDIYAPEGTQLYACIDGEIYDPYISGSYGNTLTIMGDYNGTTYYFFYAHLQDKVSYKAGDKVKVGDKIGFSGKTGSSAKNLKANQVHLHFEVRTKGTRTGNRISPTNTISEFKESLITNPKKEDQL